MNNVSNEKNAKVMASSGLVKRTGDHFTVYSDKRFGASVLAKVNRIQNGEVACTCDEFANQIIKENGFKCEHILAVKFAIGLKNTENYETPIQTINNVLQFSTSPSRFIKETQPIGKTTTNLSLVDPVAKTYHELVTGRQLAMIRDFAKTGSVIPEKVCEKVWGLSPNELSRAAASAFIAYLASNIPLAAKELNLKQAA